MVVLVQLVAVALAGYGDALDGYPSPDERLLHLYTNAARVEPEAFEADYAVGGCSTADFSDDELTPKPPYLWHHGLNEIARVHSEDMRDRGYFAHDTLDGPTWDARIRPYYPDGAIGENIASGYADAWAAVFHGWMCSTQGHRGAIMSGGYRDLGVGIADRYYTQDFGGGSGQPERWIAMGAHTVDGMSLELFADYFHPAGVPPDKLEVELGPARHPMTLEWGEPAAGVYRLLIAMPGPCAPYAFHAGIGAFTERFPEEGWYGVGDCDWDDERAMWLSSLDDGGTGGGTGGGAGTGGGTGGGAGTGGADGGTSPWGSPTDGDAVDTGGRSGKKEAPGGCACDASPVGALGWLPLLTLALVRRRRG